MRILFVSGEVAPFTTKSEIASLSRHLPDQLHETGRFETRIMMPRYGIVSERRNRLHEVIRLSDNDIPMGGQSESLKVKVASIPGIRLQVYFMDNARLFKRKGVFADKSGKVFEDNPERAAFFGRAVIETIRNLGWDPDLVHTFGWMSGLVPFMLRSVYADDPLFANSRIVHTPYPVEFEAPYTRELLEGFGLPAHKDVVDVDANAIGRAYADAVILPGGVVSENGLDQFGEDHEGNREIASAVYERVLASVTA
jgi:starch synthase